MGRHTLTEQINKKRNAVYVRRHPRGRSATSARAIRIKQRQAEVLTYRLNGHSYSAIGKQMHIDASTAHNYMVQALARIVPVETAQTVLRMELARLDAMEAAIFNHATGGDLEAIKVVLQIGHERARLCGLIDTKHPDRLGVNLNILSGQDAEAVGIQVEFVTPSHKDEVAPYLGGNTEPKLIGNGSSWRGPKEP
jgi:DNA-binding CsgD family transcriptional regulator